MSSQIHPPGPSFKTLLRLIPGALRDPAEFLLGLARDYGDLTCLKLGIKNAYLIGSAEYSEDILVARQGEFSNWVAWFIKKIDLLEGEGLLALESEGHQARRSLVEPTFVRERISMYCETVTDYGVRLRDKWTHGQSTDIEADMGRLSLGITIKMLFNLDIETDGKEIGDIMSRLMYHYSAAYPPVLLFQPVLRKIPYSHVRGLLKAKDELSDMIYRIIAERRKNVSDNCDLLSSMIAARSAGGVLSKMTDTQIRDECKPK